MTVQTDAIPDVPKTPRNVSGPRTVPLVAQDEQRDLELVAAVAAGGSEALRSLATRMGARVERVARALIGAASEDAALHALIEVLRSHASYRGKLRLERWADRVAAISVMRQAHARHNVAPTAAPIVETGSTARTFEQYLGALTESARQFLLLRHALGLGISELADAMQCSQQAARERLLSARRELRALVRRRESHPPTLNGGAGLGGQRWCALRDREALGEALLPDEQEEVTLLEAKEPEVWAYVAQVRALELYFDTRSSPRVPNDDTLIERSLEALELSASSLRARAIVDDPALETRTDREPSNWVGVFAWAASAALAAASAIALYWHEPARPPVLVRDPAPAMVAPVPAPAAPPKPFVESLPSARTATRGSRLRRAGHALPEGTMLGQGDTLEASERAGCVEIAPAFEACLAPGSALTLSALETGSRRITLLRGRIVMRGHEASGSARASVVVDDVTASTQHGALALERAGDAVRVRALRGPVTLQTASESRDLAEGEGAQVQAGALTVAPAQASLLQRDWDVLATGLHQAAALKPAKPRAAVPKLEGEPDAVLAETLREDE